MSKKFYKDPNIKITPTHKFAINRFAAVCKTGRVIGSQFSHGGLTIHRAGISHSRIHINHHILRNALINSKEELAEYCGIRIIDLQESVSVVPEIEKPIEQPVEPKEEVILNEPTEEPVSINKELASVLDEPVPTKNVGEVWEKDEKIIEGPTNDEPKTEPEYGEEVDTPIGKVKEVVKKDEYQEKLDALNDKTNLQLREILAGFGVKTNSKMNKKELINLFINNHLV